MNNSEMIFGLVIAGILMLFIALFFILLIVRYRHKQLENKKNLAALEYEYKEGLLRTQIEIQEQTLNTISQEIHDNIGQVLSLAKLNLNTFPPDLDAPVVLKINNTKQLIGKAIKDLRDLSATLYNDKVEESGLKEAIESELKIIQNTGQFITHFLVNGNVHSLGPQVEIVLFRIVQEALNNSLKHSKANNISVCLDYLQGSFTLKVEDDGVGHENSLAVPLKPGIGLKSMQKRAGLIKAQFSVLQNAAGGTSIIVNLNKHSSTS